MTWVGFVEELWSNEPLSLLFSALTYLPERLAQEQLARLRANGFEPQSAVAKRSIDQCSSWGVPVATCLP